MALSYQIKINYNIFITRYLLCCALNICRFCMCMMMLWSFIFENVFKIRIYFLKLFSLPNLEVTVHKLYNCNNEIITSRNVYHIGSLLAKKYVYIVLNYCSQSVENTSTKSLLKKVTVIYYLGMNFWLIADDIIKLLPHRYF